MPRPSSTIVLTAFAVAAVVDLMAEFAGWHWVAMACRFVLMPLLALYVWSSARRRDRLVILVVLALGFSWLGDFAGVTMILKIMFFLLAQIVYVVAFAPFWRRSVARRPPLLIAYGIALLILVGAVAAAAGPFAIPVALYGAFLAGMAVLATGVDRLTGLGGALFLVSDIVLAVELFVAPGAIPHVAFVNMAIYLPAQVMIALGVLRAVATPAKTPGEAVRPIA